MNEEGSEKVSLFFALLPNWKIIFGFYTAMYLTGHVKIPEFISTPWGSSGSVLWLVKSTPSPF